MTWSREITIWCDRCQQWVTRSGNTVAGARKEIRALGWVVRRAHDGQMVDLCPECKRKPKEVQP